MYKIQEKRNKNVCESPDPLRPKPVLAHYQACSCCRLCILKEYIDDTEDFINIQLDNVRNQLIQFELLLTTATFVVTIFGVVAGVFGMNFNISLFKSPTAFKCVLLITGVAGAILFSSFLWFFKHKRLMPL
ncbi:putative magnesium transporter MRS2 [Helianthus annuus]|nr:putative magnesium transporter MRS2 [Helianthus annuus]